MNLKLEFATCTIFLFINIHALRKCLFAACNKEWNLNFLLHFEVFAGRCLSVLVNKREFRFQPISAFVYI